jgi:hypothetical protein
VFALTPLAWIVPVDLLITKVAGRSAQPGRAGLGRHVAHAAIPVEDVDERRLLLGDQLRELVGCLLFWSAGTAAWLGRRPPRNCASRPLS